jgi:hypothetical protein
MDRRRIMNLALTGMMAIALSAMTALTAHAQQPSVPDNSQKDLNLSNAQVSRLQALLLAETKETRSLQVNVQAAQETLKSAVAQGDPVRIATAVLSLDAAEKALRNTELANQRSLTSLLNDSQKQVIANYSAKSVPASD